MAGYVAPVAYAPAPVVAYRPAPVAYKAETYPDEISPYTYTYAVADDYSKAQFSAEESSDGAGTAQGSCSVALPSPPKASDFIYSFPIKLAYLKLLNEVLMCILSLPKDIRYASLAASLCDRPSF